MHDFALEENSLRQPRIERRSHWQNMQDTVLIIFCLLAACFVLAQGDPIGNVYYEGDTCLNSESKQPGICRRISHCESVLNAIRHGKTPQKCSFINAEQVVCCPQSLSPLNHTEVNRINQDDSENEIDENRLRAVEKIKAKCEQYGNFLSAVTSPTPVTTSTQKPLRRRHGILLFSRFGLENMTSEEVPDPRISGGTQATYREFPHMAAIGFGEPNKIDWSCGGSLISEQYILTAAHCLQSRSGEIANWVRIGRTNLDSVGTPNSRPQQFNIIARIPHPGYQLGKFYNDIALLKLDKPVIFNDDVRPACLQTDDVETGKTCIATGWGLVDENRRHGSKDLMKVDLRVQNSTVCDTVFEPLKTNTRKLLSGFTSDTMICAGDPSKKDTCSGDSGGPIQIKLNFPPGMHSIIGVTSFGTGDCGSVSAAAVYTRVSYYLPWIVDTIWPTK